MAVGARLRRGAPAAARKPDHKIELGRYLTLARNSVRAGKFALAIDYCRQITEAALRLNRNEIALEAFYIWGLSYLKTGKYQDARKICYDARDRLGNYLDVVYFEILIAAANAETDKIPRLAQNYFELRDPKEHGKDPQKTRTWDKAGEVLILWGRALETLNEPLTAAEVYTRYLAICPEDKVIAARASALIGRTDK